MLVFVEVKNIDKFPTQLNTGYLETTWIRNAVSSRLKHDCMRPSFGCKETTNISWPTIRTKQTPSAYFNKLRRNPEKAHICRSKSIHEITCMKQKYKPKSNSVLRPLYLIHESTTLWWNLKRWHIKSRTRWRKLNILLVSTPNQSFVSTIDKRNQWAYLYRSKIAYDGVPHSVRREDQSCRKQRPFPSKGA